MGQHQPGRQSQGGQGVLGDQGRQTGKHWLFQVTLQLDPLAGRLYQEVPHKLVRGLSFGLAIQRWSGDLEGEAEGCRKAVRVPDYEGSWTL